VLGVQGVGDRCCEAIALPGVFNRGRVLMMANRSFDTDAQARAPLRGSWCMRAGQLQR